MQISPIASADAAEPHKLGCVGRQFIVRGAKIGGAVVTFSATKNGGRLYSEPFNLQVTKKIIKSFVVDMT